MGVMLAQEVGLFVDNRPPRTGHRPRVDRARSRARRASLVQLDPDPARGEIPPRVFMPMETIVIDDPRRCTELVVENGAKTRAYVHPARV
jgi:hypothetical protein